MRSSRIPNTLAVSMFLAGAAVAAGLAGCGGAAHKTTTPASGATGADSANVSATLAARPITPENVPNTETASGVHIDDKIRKACGITDQDAYFAFDSANLRPSDQRVLDLVAKCFISGPLTGKGMRLVGHADPRGTPDYNRVLGLNRAQSVQSYFMKDGLDKGKVDTTSRGADDATGTDEAGWAKDRRVDVMLSE
jgi:peptidoglycan-associated lipoprotein